MTVENLGVTGGTYVTPVFVGFHDGTFDLFDGGSPASTELEAIAEDGNAGPLGTSFANAGFTGGTVGGGPLAPGASGSRDFTIMMGANTSRLLLATMVLPTNDWFLGNGDPMGLDLSNLGAGPQTFVLDRLYDAGTEVNDFATSAGNPLLNVPGGQLGVPNTGMTEGGNISLVGTIQADGSVVGTGGTIANPFSGFANLPAGFNPGLGQVRVTVTAVPEPSTVLALGAFAVGAVVTHRRRRAKKSVAK
ncbi:MAG: spondin domain-containing protein [Planctomycetota bacterium]